MDLEDFVKLRGRFELDRRASENGIDAGVDHRFPGEADLTKVLGPRYVVEGQIIPVENDALKISVSEADANLVMESEV